MEGAVETLQKMTQEAEAAEAKNREQAELIKQLQRQVQSLQDERDRQRRVHQQNEEDGRDLSPTKQALMKEHRLELEKKERELADMRALIEYERADYTKAAPKVDTNLPAARELAAREKEQKKLKEAEDAKRKQKSAEKKLRDSDPRAKGEDPTAQLKIKTP